MNAFKALESQKIRAFLCKTLWILRIFVDKTHF
jgi:hypothetical protein